MHVAGRDRRNPDNAFPQSSPFTLCVAKPYTRSGALPGKGNLLKHKDKTVILPPGYTDMCWDVHCVYTLFIHVFLHVPFKIALSKTFVCTQYIYSCVSSFICCLFLFRTFFYNKSFHLLSRGVHVSDKHGSYRHRV